MKTKTIKIKMPPMTEYSIWDEYDFLENALIYKYYELADDSFAEYDATPQHVQDFKERINYLEAMSRKAEEIKESHPELFL